MLETQLQTIENAEGFPQVQQCINMIGDDLTNVSIFVDLDRVICPKGYRSAKSQLSYGALDTIQYCVLHKASVFLMTYNESVSKDLVAFANNMFNPKFTRMLKSSLPPAWPQEEQETLGDSFNTFCGNVVLSADGGFSAHTISQKLTQEYGRTIKLMMLIGHEAPFIEDFCMFAYASTPSFPAIAIKFSGGMTAGYYNPLVLTSRAFDISLTDEKPIERHASFFKKHVSFSDERMPSLTASSSDLKSESPVGSFLYTFGDCSCPSISVTPSDSESDIGSGSIKRKLHKICPSCQGKMAFKNIEIVDSESEEDPKPLKSILKKPTIKRFPSGACMIQTRPLSTTSMIDFATINRIKTICRYACI